MKRTAWGMAAAAVLMHLCIGSVYAWSVLVQPVMRATGADLAAVQWVFSLAIAALGTSAAFLGSWVERIGPSRAGLAATACFVGGMYGTAQALAAGALWPVYLAYGLLGGIGLGIGYITPVATLVKWFPRRKGMATGLAIMGFGFAALIAGPAWQRLMTAYDLPTAFRVLATVYGIVMTGASLYLAPPATVTTDGARRYTGMTVREAVRTRAFYLIWLIFFINITCGIGILSIAAPLAAAQAGLTPAQAAAFVGLLGVVNGIGRLGWACISDGIGRLATYALLFFLQIPAYLLLTQAVPPFVVYPALALIVTCYGGGFSVLPATLAERYGMAHLSAIHGRLLTAWAAAGIAGPVLIVTWAGDAGDFSAALAGFALLSAVALAATFVLYWQEREQRETVS